MDMKEMSLSKEVYDKKPGLFFTIFIYGLFALVITAAIWAYFGRLDVVVRAQGIIRPNAQTAVVLNALHGELTGVYFYEGQRVYRGDVLYTLDTFHLENDRQLLTQQLSQLNFELESLELFHDSIYAGENLINSFNYEASARLDSFLVSLGAIEHGANNRLRSFQEEESALETAIAHARFEVEVLRAFENSVNRGQDLFGGAPENNRDREVRNNYRNQFLHFTLERDNLRFQIETAEASLLGYRQIRNSINNGYSVFAEHCIYRSMYEEFLLQLQTLEENIAIATENYRVYASLYQGGAASYAERQAAFTMLETAYARVAEAESNFAIRIDNEIRNGENAVTRLQNQVELLRASTLAGISTQATALETAIVEMNTSLSQSRVQQDAMFFVEDEAGDAAMLRLGELNRTHGEMSIIEQEAARLTLSLASIDAQIEDSTVRAPIDGIVTIHTELTEGGFILAGAQVLSIIPAREDTLSANIFINNNDIGQILEGMTVRYDIAAMPRRDFGEITGYITRISTDISTEQGTVGYFLIESELADIVYYDSRGNGTTLRVGMAFDARIVVDQERILFFLLDRLNLLLN